MTSDALIRLLHLRDDRSAGNGHVDLAAPTGDPDPEVAQLRAALVSNRRISMAVGIVMRDQNVDEDQAFAYLRRTSQDSNASCATSLRTSSVTAGSRPTRGEPRGSIPEPLGSRPDGAGRSPTDLRSV